MTISSSTKEPARPLFLGIEGGGTRTVALLADARRHFLQRFEVGPANIKLLNDAQLVRILRSIAEAFPQPDALAIGMAGARTEEDWARIRNAAAKVWPHIHAYATNDLETALTATEEKDVEGAQARILVLSGTGSCCYGRNREGKTGKIGGWVPPVPVVVEKIVVQVELSVEVWIWNALP